VLAYQKRLQDSQWWPAEQLLEHQLRELARLVAHAWRTVPFHGARLAAAGLEPGRLIDLERWQRLAPLTRRDIQQAGGDLESTAVPAEHGKILTTRSSGSTGTPVTVRGTIFDAVVGKALMLRHCLWHPYDFAAKFASIRRVHGGTYDYPHGLHLDRWGDSATFPFATGPSSILSIGASIAIPTPPPTPNTVCTRTFVRYAARSCDRSSRVMLYTGNATCDITYSTLMITTCGMRNASE